MKARITKKEMGAKELRFKPESLNDVVKLKELARYLNRKDVEFNLATFNHPLADGQEFVIVVEEKR